MMCGTLLPIALSIQVRTGIPLADWQAEAAVARAPLSPLLRRAMECKRRERFRSGGSGHPRLGVAWS